MAAITISRQLGSWGNEIAQQAAQRLGYRLVEREVINQAALRCGSPQVALAMIDELGLLGLRPSGKEFDAYHEAVECVIQGLADESGVIIVGRAGQVILRQRPDVLHVRVIAPASVRVQRLAAEQNMTLAAAHAQVGPATAPAAAICAVTTMRAGMTWSSTTSLSVRSGSTWRLPPA